MNNNNLQTINNNNNNQINLNTVKTSTLNINNLSPGYNNYNSNSIMNNSINNPLINHSFLNSNLQGKLSINDVENPENIKRLNYENLNNNIYTKITGTGKTKPNIGPGRKKNLKKFKIQNTKTKIYNIENKMNRNFIFFFYFSLLTVFIVLICDYPFKLSTFTFSHKLSEINYYILGMKSEVLSTASAIITACTRADNIDEKNISGFENSMEKIKDIIGNRSADLNSFTYRFFSYLDEINYEGVDKLYQVINHEDNYNFLYTDWTTYTRKSSFITQLKNFIYLCRFMKINNQFNTCRVRERFYNRNFLFDYSNLADNVNSIFLNSEENLKIQSNAENNNKKISPEEAILFYVFENIITTYKENLLNLTLISNSILESYHKKAAVYLLAYNSGNLFLIVLLFILMFYLLIYKKNTVMYTFLKLFTVKNSDKFFEMKMLNFKSILNCFDKNNCLEYEKKKHDIVQLEEKILSDSFNTSIKIEEQTKLKKALKADKTSLYSVSSRNTGAITSKDKSSMRGELASLNSASIMKEKDSNSLDIYSNEFLEEVKFDHLDSKVYRFGKYFLFLGGLILIILNLIKIVENFTKFDRLIKGNLIASNFLERMPKFGELFLYYKISIIYKEVNFIRNKNAIDNLQLNYYNVSIDVSKEGIFSSLKESQYSNIYYQFRVIQANLKIFMNDFQDDIILKNIRILESKLNTKDFCSHLAEAYTEFIHKFNGNYYESFKHMNLNAEECKIIGNGMNNNPLNSILESIITILNNNYYDFNNSKDKNITKFIGSDDIVRANLEFEYVFKKIHDSINYLIKSDIDYMYNSNLYSEISFSLATISIFTVYIFIFMLFVVNKMNRCNSNLTYTLGRFKKATKHD